MSATATVTFRDRILSWEGVCDCGWTTSSPSSAPHHSDLLFVTNQGESHLNDEHGATNQLRRRHGKKTVTLTGVDRRLLLADQSPESSDFKGTRLTIPVAIVWIIVWWLFLLAGDADDHPTLQVVLLVASFVFGLALVFIQIVSDKEQWRERLANEHLESVAPDNPDSPSTAPGTSTGSRSGPHYWATGNYDPERYYAATHGWSKEQRDYVRDAYGDLDTYESNRPD